MSNPQKISATVIDIIDHSDKVYTLTFETDRRIPRFKPGQFLHLAIDEFDPSTGYWPESRVFSIATAASSNEVSIAYSVKGAYTSRMEKELKLGSSVWLKFPYGSFIVDEIIDNGAPAVLVAGGTGLTPFVSFIHNEATMSSSRTICLFYGIRKTSLLLFQPILEHARRSCSGFSLSLFIEEEEGEAPFPAVLGRLDARKVIKTCEELGNTPVFIAGPPAMMASFRSVFTDSGIASNKIIIDEWE